MLVDLGYGHVRATHSSDEFARERVQVNGVERVWGMAKVRRAKFKGLPKQTFRLDLEETEWRFNNQASNKSKLLLRYLRKIRSARHDTTKNLSMKRSVLTQEVVAKDHSAWKRSRSLNYTDIASILRRKIVRGDFNSTKMLPSQRSLAESYNVARQTVRKAIKQIETEGLVKTKDRNGTFLLAQSFEERGIALSKFPRLDLMETRSCLEQHICKLVTINARKNDLDALDQLCDKIEARPKNWRVFVHADVDFHLALAHATRNSLICRLSEKIGSLRIDDLILNSCSNSQSDAAIAQLSMQHRKIVRALRSRESTIAANAMKLHVNEEHIYSAMFRANI